MQVSAALMQVSAAFMRVSAAIIWGRACCPTCRRQHLPPTGGGSCSCATSLLRSFLPQSVTARCTPYAPLSVGAVGWEVGCPSCSVALPASGVIFGRGCSPGLLARVRAGHVSGLVAGLVGSRPGWSCVRAAHRAGRCSGGRIITKCSFSIVGYSLLPSVAGSLGQSLIRQLFASSPRKGVLNDI